MIRASYKDSTPWWPPRVVPPKGAPNVLLIMTDDQVPFPFNGTIDKLTFNLGPTQLTPAEQQKAGAASATAHD